MPTLEILRLTTSGPGPFPTDPVLLEPVKKLLGSAEGVVAAYFGVKKEDDKVAYLVVIWESFEHHKKLINLPDYEKKVEVIFEPLSKPVLHLKHLEFANLDDITKVLGAPVTEVVDFEPKRDGVVDDADFIGKLEKLKVELEPETRVSMIWSKTRETPHNMFALLGWDTVEAHWKAVEREVPKGIILELASFAQIDISHSKLDKII